MTSHSICEAHIYYQVYITETISITHTMLGVGIVFSPKCEQYFHHNLCSCHRITSFGYGISYYRPQQTVPAHHIEDRLVYSEVLLTHKPIWKSVSLPFCPFQCEIRNSSITSELQIRWRRLSIDYYTTDCNGAFYCIRSKRYRKLSKLCDLKTANIENHPQVTQGPIELQYYSISPDVIQSRIVKSLKFKQVFIIKYSSICFSFHWSF
jgi:hypothetical protein